MRLDTNGRVGQKLRQPDSSSSQQVKTMFQVVEESRTSASLSRQLADFASSLGLPAHQTQLIESWSDAEIKQLDVQTLQQNGFDAASAPRIVAKARGLSQKQE
eukprot:c3536_g1_i1.p1 GENE.c3536_g1_i1~~c3536_g1_i1.p1  ORF type:complete len:103 (+),score=24.56 c3536_g1_i1:69-377(+)